LHVTIKGAIQDLHTPAGKDILRRDPHKQASLQEDTKDLALLTIARMNTGPQIFLGGVGAILH
jgi:hypothetical protein